MLGDQSYNKTAIWHYMQSANHFETDFSINVSFFCNSILFGIIISVEDFSQSDCEITVQ